MSEAFAPGRHAIEAYGGGQFSFAGMRRTGAILATPSGVRAAQVSAPEGIDEAVLAPLFDEPKGAVETLIVGTGANLRRLPPALAARLKAAGIAHETMATGPAARVYNVMLQEGRRVAALLLPAP